MADMSEGWYMRAGQQAYGVEVDRSQPFCLYRPDLRQDGDKWIACYGDFPVGVVGVGDSPSEAERDFNRAWFAKAAGEPPGEKTCAWTLQGDWFYLTSCGYNAGILKEVFDSVGIRYCHHCGGRVEVKGAEAE